MSHFINQHSEYHRFNAAQRRRVKRDELQSLLDEHIITEGNVISLRGIIHDELKTLEY